MTPSQWARQPVICQKAAAESRDPMIKLKILLSEFDQKAYSSRQSRLMELFIFGRFHALPDSEGLLAEAIAEVLAPSRAEAGCLGIHAFRSTRDPRLFYIHSRWIDETAFDKHAALPHTVRFLERVQPLIDHALDITRAKMLG